MKKFGAFLVLLLTGFICGVTVATLNIAFEPKQCGEDCANIAWSSMLTWMPICTLAFPVIGVFAWSKGALTWKRLFVISLALVLIAILPAIGIYLYRAGHQ